MIRDLLKLTLPKKYLYLYNAILLLLTNTHERIDISKYKVHFLIISYCLREQALNGMRLLVRLLRHHAQSLESNYHSIVLIISEKANDLRSQVARAASQVAVELFRGNHRLSETVRN